MGGNLFGIGFGELIFILILALVVFGPKRIPEMARTIGRFVQQMRQATGGIEDEMRRLMAGEGDPSTWLAGAPPPVPSASPLPAAEPFSPPPTLVPGPPADEPSPPPGDDTPAIDDGPAAIPPAPAG